MVLQKEKVVNGVTLIYSEQDKMFAYPLPEGSEVRFLLDEDRGTFIPVQNNPSPLFRERKVTAPDGTVIVERIIYRDPREVDDLTIEEYKKFVLAKELQTKREYWELIRSFKWVFVLGLMVSAGVFFWNFLGAVAEGAAVIAQYANMAFAEAAYYLVWGACILFGLLVIRFALPLIFRPSAPTFEYNDPSGAETCGGGDIHINVQQEIGRRNSPSEAQRILTNRNF